MALGLAGLEGVAGARRCADAAAPGLAGGGSADALNRGIGALGLTGLERGLPVVTKRGVIVCSPAAQESLHKTSP